MTDATQSRFFGTGIFVALIALILDQITKWWILNDVMAPPRVIPVTDFFNLVLGWNRGVSFGLFNQQSDYGPWILTGVAAIIVIGLFVWMWRATTKCTALALGMVIGGAVGNVIDRLQFGAVVDFLDFHVAGYHWPAFNVADTAICIGAAMLILESLFTKEETS